MSNKGDLKALLAVTTRVGDIENRLLAIEEKAGKAAVSYEKLQEIALEVPKKADSIDLKMIQSDLSIIIIRRIQA